MEIKYIDLGNGRKDCFYVLNGECYHIERISNNCKRGGCKFYRSGIPLIKKQGKN